MERPQRPQLSNVHPLIETHRETIAGMSQLYTIVTHTHLLTPWDSCSHLYGATSFKDLKRSKEMKNNAGFCQILTIRARVSHTTES